jgi:cation:H+ antiporter
MPFSLTEQSLETLLLIMGAAGAVVWYAGSRLASLINEISERTGIGQAFAGMLLLGGITSLPELATASSASLSGNPLLSLNDLLGSSCINVLLLAVADGFFGKRALTHQTAEPAPLIQGVLGMMLMAAVAIAVLLGDTAIPAVGGGILSLTLAVGCVMALRVSNRFEHARSWRVVDPPEHDRREAPRQDQTNLRLGLLTGLAACAILIGGATLALAGGQIAEKSGLGTSIVGFALIGVCTSLPELSSTVAAVRLGRYQLAIGEIFGTNLFNIQIIFVADLFYRDGPLLNEAGPFEIAAACLSILMTGIFVVGMLERRDKTIWRFGTDSALAIAVFAAGLIGLSTLL